MKNVTTGLGLCVLGVGIASYPVLDRLVPIANAHGVGASTSIVTAAAVGQAGPNIVWYQAVGDSLSSSVYRAWSDGRIEVMFGSWRRYADYSSGQAVYCYRWESGRMGSDGLCEPQIWKVVSDPGQGYSFRSDINSDSKVDGADLGTLLADWGDAPRRDITPSDCPLNLINP